MSSLTNSTWIYNVHLFISSRVRGVPVIFGYEGIQIMAVLTRDLPDGSGEDSTTSGKQRALKRTRRRQKKRAKRNTGPGKKLTKRTEDDPEEGEEGPGGFEFAIGVYVKSIDFDGMVNNLVGTKSVSMKWLNGFKAGKQVL